MAVVAALELDDAVAVGDGASQPERRHRRLRPGVDEAHHLDGRHRLDHQGENGADEDGEGEQHEEEVVEEEY